MKWMSDHLKLLLAESMSKDLNGITRSIGA